MRESQYNTRHYVQLLDYLKEIPGRHVTIQDILSHFNSQGSRIGIATVYRLMERLVCDGLVKKYSLDGTTSACFEYIGEEGKADLNCFHCKCLGCGKLIHLECDALSSLRSHLQKDHDFVLDCSHTVFYGWCVKCRQKASE